MAGVALQHHRFSGETRSTRWVGVITISAAKKVQGVILHIRLIYCSRFLNKAT